ncbi:hypothetical protein RUM43_001488 [Polyplax serrata]|uniref:SH3 domain-containing protein n=1 Tax=Polyplax serrata TaxID=468196 RepID=A0AAN8SEF1_POLSC
MMFESSFHAIYSSYMSVLGVADNFAKLRNAFGQIFSTFAIIRTLNWIYKKLMYLLGIGKDNFTKEAVWSDAMNSASNVDNSSKTKRKTWPLLLFMSLMFGGPYLLFKLISELQPNAVREAWVPADQPGNLAVGLYDFYAASEQELSVTANQKLMIAPKKFQPTDCPGWVLACNENRKIGLVPSNYIGVLMQSEKTGQTYIEHNGQAYQPSISGKSAMNTSEDVEKSKANSEQSSKETGEG